MTNSTEPRAFTVRLDSATAERVDRLIERLRKRNPGLSVSANEAIRLVVGRGLTELERTR